ncbi:uncharacterized protein DC041_0010044 [Schistosoma bovis]|uniref:PAS domain-containing protein n=1 Tax=Schistosoma bovis TaxID=6184 RepID=A0A430QUQ3_SCHBO|nr:uncharacterized protein DC041_0010044 [Schistosoma bovis]
MYQSSHICSDANFVLGNAQRKYYPIVYCSDGFLLLTHYSRANVMSRSSICQFLWGSETTPTVRMEINQAFHNHYEYRNRAVFYTRTGYLRFLIALSNL